MRYIERNVTRFDTCRVLANMKFESGSTGSQTTKRSSSANRSLKAAFEPDSVLLPSPIPAFRRMASLRFPNAPEKDVVRAVSQESALSRSDSILSPSLLEMVRSEWPSESDEILDMIE